VAAGERRGLLLPAAAALAIGRALTMTPWCLGRPTMEGKTARGASSPANPAFTMPEPLSHTMALTSPSSAAGAWGACSWGGEAQTTLNCFTSRWISDWQRVWTPSGCPQLHRRACRASWRCTPPAIAASVEGGWESKLGRLRMGYRRPRAMAE
jgi:hypothetical protein